MWLLVFLGVLGNAAGQFICYDELGCFTTVYPWTSPDRPVPVLPEFPYLINTRFFLYTRNLDSGDPVELLAGDTDVLSSSTFTASRRTVFIVHGFTHDYKQPWVTNLRNEILAVDDVNVIAVDWKFGAGPFYLAAVANAQVVGAEIARLIDFLAAEANLVSTDVHLIGHSLGAHASGYAGDRIEQLGRITGLDPVKSYFTGSQPEVRLDSTDADFVDIIHSDAGSITEITMGLQQPTGHVDFFPNGGSTQPGCHDTLDQLFNSIDDLLNFNFEGVIDEYTCSHMRSIDLFIDSLISPYPMIGYECFSWEEYEYGNCFSLCDGRLCHTMGYRSTSVNTGGTKDSTVDYLRTTNATSYAIRSYELVVSIGEDQDVTMGELVAVVSTNKVAPISTTIFSGYISPGQQASSWVEVAALSTVTGVSLKYSPSSSFDAPSLAVGSTELRSLNDTLAVERINFAGIVLNADEYMELTLQDLKEAHREIKAQKLN